MNGALLQIDGLQAVEGGLQHVPRAVFELRRRGRLPEVGKQLGCFVQPGQSLLERGGRRAHSLRRKLRQEGPETLRQLAVAQCADVVAVDPVQLVPVEHRAAFCPPAKCEAGSKWLRADISL